MGAPEGRRIAMAALVRFGRPKRFVRVSEWADAHRILSTSGSAEAGPWKTSRTPYLREIMDQLSETSPAKLVVFMKASQIGGTEVGVNWLGYIVCHAGGPVAIVMPTEKSLNDWMSQKFDPMAHDSPEVAGRMARRNNASTNNNAERKKFLGGILYAKTAGSTSELKSTSLRYAIADEVDEYDWSTTQGDPLGLLEVRLTTYAAGRKLYVPSSPTVKDASRIEELFNAGDRRRYHLPCPHCGELQPLAWSNLRWTKAPDSQRRVSEAWYACRECGADIQEHHKTDMLARGRWIAEDPEAPYPSYHLNSLYAPIGLGLSWPELAEEWIAAQDDPAKLMRFINTRLGETWADRSRDIRPNTLMARAEPYPLRSIPRGCLVLTCGVDVQDDRLELTILGHGKHDVTWVVDYHVLPGNPADDALWRRLADYINGDFGNACGKVLRVQATGVDSGGHYTHAVYAFVRSGLVQRCMALRGVAGLGRVILGRPSHQDVNWRGATIKRGVRLYSVGVDTCKHLLYARLNGDADKSPDLRKVRFSQDLEAPYYDGLVAETYNPRRHRWEVKRGKRNEPLDTWNYALAASHHPELYLHKWRPGDWDRLVAQIEPEQGAEASADAPPAASPPPATPAHHPARPRGGFVNRWKGQL